MIIPSPVELDGRRPGRQGRQIRQARYACLICFNAKKLDADSPIAGAELAGTIPRWQWIGDEAATTSSF